MGTRLSNPYKFLNSKKKYDDDYAARLSHVYLELSDNQKRPHVVVYSDPEFTKCINFLEYDPDDWEALPADENGFKPDTRIEKENKLAKLREEVNNKTEAKASEIKTNADSLINNENDTNTPKSEDVIQINIPAQNRNNEEEALSKSVMAMLKEKDIPNEIKDLDNGDFVNINDTSKIPPLSEIQSDTQNKDDNDSDNETSDTVKKIRRKGLFGRIVETFDGDDTDELPEDINASEKDETNNKNINNTPDACALLKDFDGMDLDGIMSDLDDTNTAKPETKEEKHKNKTKEEKHEAPETMPDTDDKNDTDINTNTDNNIDTDTDNNTDSDTETNTDNNNNTDTNNDTNTETNTDANIDEKVNIEVDTETNTDTDTDNITQETDDTEDELFRKEPEKSTKNHISSEEITENVINKVLNKLESINNDETNEPIQKTETTPVTTTANKIKADSNKGEYTMNTEMNATLLKYIITEVKSQIDELVKYADNKDISTYIADSMKDKLSKVEIYVEK